MFLPAYIGPGAGLSLIGALIGLIASIAFSLFMIVAYPLRMLMKKQASASQAESQQAAESTPAAPAN